MTCKWQVENDPFCQKVLAKHWPEVERYGDIKEVGELPWVDLICGGFPCQDVSDAGEKAGIDGSRSGLWKEFFRIIRLVRPSGVLVENVQGLRRRGLDRVLGDLAQIRYDAEWRSIPAAIFGGSHQRERVFILAYPVGSGLQGSLQQHGLRGTAAKASAQFGNRNITCGGWWRQNLSNVHLGDGVPRRLASRHLRVMGNAVVPQVAEWIGRQIMAAVKAQKEAA